MNYKETKPSVYELKVKILKSLFKKLKKIENQIALLEKNDRSPKGGKNKDFKYTLYSLKDKQRNINNQIDQITRNMEYVTLQNIRNNQNYNL